MIEVGIGEWFCIQQTKSIDRNKALNLCKLMIPIWRKLPSDDPD
jgi:hypothetical protein